VVSISSFTGGSSAPARAAVTPRAPELQRPANGRQCKDRPGSLGLGVVAGARRNGPARSHAQRTAERRAPSAANTRARHCSLASASGPELWQYVCAVIKLNINLAVAYILYICAYGIWLSLAIKIMALHPTPLESLSPALGSRRHWKIPPAAVCFCRSRGVQIFCRLCFGTPDFPTANSQMRNKFW
jgi:hypothetical protein